MNRDKLGNVSRGQLKASLCRQSFYYFVQTFWDVTSAEIPIWNWHIKYLCDETQKIMERIFKNQPKEYDAVINIAPSSSKSSIFSIMLIPWAWTRMPTARFICGSNTDRLALKLSIKCRDIIKSDRYRKSFPGIDLRKDQDAKGSWANTLGGERTVCTVSGQSPIGMHAHALIIDDPVDPETAESEAEIARATRWMTNTLPSRVVNRAVVPTILIMQRFNDRDPSAEMLENHSGPIKHFCFPAEVTEDIKPEECKKFYVDGLFDPIRLPKSELLKIENSNLYIYAGQYLQNPVPVGGGMFKKEWFNDKLIDFAPSNLRIIRSWDKAGTASNNSAFTCGTLVGTDDNGKFFVLDEERGRWESTERNGIIRNTAELDGWDVKIAFEVEPGSGGKESAAISVKELVGYIVITDRPVTNKMARAQAFATQCKAGNVYILKRDWTKSWIDEVCRFPLGKLRDRVDSVVSGFNHLVLDGKIDLHKALDNIIAKIPPKGVIIGNGEELPFTDEVGVQWFPTYEEYHVWRIINGEKKFVFSSGDRNEALLAAMLFGVPVGIKDLDRITEQRQHEIRNQLGFIETCPT